MFKIFFSIFFLSFFILFVNNQYDNVCSCTSTTYVDCCYMGFCSGFDCKDVDSSLFCNDPCPYDLEIGKIGACCDVTNQDPPKCEGEDKPRGILEKCMIFGEPHIVGFNKEMRTCDMKSPENIISNNELWTVTVEVDYGVNWPVRHMTKVVGVTVSFKEVTKSFTYSIKGNIATGTNSNFGSEEFTTPCAKEVTVTSSKISLGEGSFVQITDRNCHLNLALKTRSKEDTGICKVGCTDNTLAVPPGSRRSGETAPENDECSTLKVFKDECNYDVYLTGEVEVYSTSIMDAETIYNELFSANVYVIVGTVGGISVFVVICIIICVIAFLKGVQQKKKKKIKPIPPQAQGLQQNPVPMIQQNPVVIQRNPVVIQRNPVVIQQPQYVQQQPQYVQQVRYVQTPVIYQPQHQQVVRIMPQVSGQVYYSNPSTPVSSNPSSPANSRRNSTNTNNIVLTRSVY